MKRALPFLIIIAVLGIAIGLFALFKNRTSDGNRSAPSIASGRSQAGSTIKLGAEPAHNLGSVDAPVMLEEFGDFECAACGTLHPMLQDMKREFGASLVIVFREFPLPSRHPHALDAARAAEAAGRQGKFWQMHDLLYENQGQWHEVTDGRPIFEGFANQLGLDLTKFRADILGEDVNLRINLDRERGYSIGVNSTPTIFLNGREVPVQSLDAAKLRELIRKEIELPSGR